MQYSVLEYLEESARKYPDKVAFLEQKQEMTFSETKRRALCIAKAIREACALRRQPILVYLPKGVSCIASFMGILYSGNFYTPTDVKFPFPKLQGVMDVLHPALILTDTKNKAKLLCFFHLKT